MPIGLYLKKNTTKYNACDWDQLSIYKNLLHVVSFRECDTWYMEYRI